jgi:hypothetical protein
MEKSLELGNSLEERIFHLKKDLSESPSAPLQRRINILEM